MKKGTCWKKRVDVFDLLIAEDSEFNLTRDRVYVARGIGGYVSVVNDLGETEWYSQEYFRFYEGEQVE